MKDSELNGPAAKDSGRLHQKARSLAILKVIRPFTEDRVLLAVVFFSILFSFVFSAFSILKMYSLSASGWDLGLQAQIMYTTLHGQLFYTNLLGFSLLQEHFSPFVFLILGVFFLHQSPVTLLVLQAIFVSFAALPLYLFGRTFMGRLGLKPGFGERILLFALVISYLVSPLTEGLIFFDFHIMAFLPFFFFLSFYAYFSGRKILNVVSLVLIVSLHSNFVFIAAMVIVTEYFLRYLAAKRNRVPENRARANLKENRASNKYFTFLTVLVSFLLLLIYLLLAGYAKSSIAGSGSFDLTFHTGEVGGYSSVSGLLMGLLTNPLAVVRLFTHDSAQKLILLYYAFGSTGFLSLLSPVALLPSIPFFLYSFLSTNTAYYALGYQYPAMLIPAVFISSVTSVAALSSLRKSSGKILFDRKRWRIAFSIILVLIVAGSINSATVAPLSQSPLYHPLDAFNVYHTPNVGNSTAAIVYLSNNINRSSYILTQNNLFPFFSTFPNSYSTPWSPGVNNSTVSNFEYIVADYSSSWVGESNGPEPSIASVVNRLLLDHSYGIYAESSSILAIKKGYKSPPVYFAPLKSVYRPAELHIDNGTILSNGTLAAQNTNHSFLWNGPYIPVMPGSYQVTYSIGMSNFTVGSYLNLDISSSSGGPYLFSKSIVGTSETASGLSYFTVTANLTVELPVSGVEFRGYGSFNGTVFLKSITIYQTIT